jgi:hypothetical protein
VCHVSHLRFCLIIPLAAGRKQFMKLHFHYTDMLLKRKLVDEVHVWDFCIQNTTNRAYLLETVASLNNPKYLYFKPPETDIKRRAFKRGDGYLWESFYNHYATHMRYRDHDIFIKADDDVAFVDITKFGHFIDGISTLNLYFPTIVNNDIGLYVHAMRNVHPNMVQWYEEYRDRHHINFVHRMRQYLFPHDLDGNKAFRLHSGHVCPMTCYMCDLTTYNWDNGSYARGDFATDMHEAFLQDPEAFLRATATAKNESASTATTAGRYFTLRRRISINMFAGFFSVIREMFSFFLDRQCCDDEGFVGKWPSLTHLDHKIDSHFTIVHFAFNPQYEMFRAQLQDAYDRYERLADKLYEEEFPGEQFAQNAWKPADARGPVNFFQM